VLLDPEADAGELEAGAVEAALEPIELADAAALAEREVDAELVVGAALNAGELTAGLAGEADCPQAAVAIDRSRTGAARRFIWAF